MSEGSNIVYVHGRPSGHPIHNSYAISINAEFIAEDYLIPYLEYHSHNKILKYQSYIVNAVFLGIKFRKKQLILTECVRIPIWIAYKLWFIPSSVKKVALMADESLYFTYTKKYPKATLWLMKQYFLDMDYLICIGAYQEELAKKILPATHHHKIKKIFNGLSEEKMNLLQNNSPTFEDNRWIFIGNINVPFRVYYKGVDLMLESLCLIDDAISWSLDIVGECPKEIQSELLSRVPESIHSRIRFLGVQYIEDIISQYNLCIHVARGDSFPTSVIETTAAGIPTLVSYETGTKEIVELIDSSFVVPLSASHIAKKISDYAHASIEAKQVISKKSKEVAIQYREIEARKLFVEIIGKLI